MKESVKKQIQNVNDSIEWVRDNRPEHFNQKFLQLVEQRRSLRSIEKALDENPAIAAFGESQKGKSYLMGNLLQNSSSPFKVLDNNGDEIDFVKSINPIGLKREATGVVTRFTSFIGKEERYSRQYPVLIKLLSVANIATILCDGYYNDISDGKTYSESELKEISSMLYNRYSVLPLQSSPVVSADDILDIKHYISRYVKGVQNLKNSNYFETLALIIERVPSTEFADVLKYLWSENGVLSDKFGTLVKALSRLSFAKEVYVPLEAVKHHGLNINTIMSVKCLNGLDNASLDLTTDVYVRNPAGEYVRIAEFPKPELSAICAEAIYKVEEKFLEDKPFYAFDADKIGQPGELPAETKAKLENVSTCDLLRNTDLLDFPGARSRLSLKEIFLDKTDEETNTSNWIQLYLRGKVAFLFNHYNDSRIINILFFCQDNEQPSVTNMYSMIEDWVNNYVGEKPEDRRRTISSYGNISPLFVIATKFNIDMVLSGYGEHNTVSALNERWNGRFMTVLYTQSFEADAVDWFKNWDAPGATFKNTYLLRDFKYSGCTGEGNNLYEGYNEETGELSETRLHLSAQFYNSLRQSFIESEDVRTFFADPAKAWDVATTRNNDGSLYIIHNLAKAAANAGVARETIFAKGIEEAKAKVKAIINGYYVSTDSDELLKKNISKARNVVRELDFTCNEDNYYFGHLIQALQMSESECLAEVHRLLQSTELNQTVHSFKEYQLIRKRCGEFVGCNNEKSKIARIVEAYSFIDEEDARRYMQRRGIDMSMLLSGDFKKKLNSNIIADGVMKMWVDKIRSVELLGSISGDGSFDPIVMGDLIDNLVEATEYVGLASIMEDAIAEYVNVINLGSANESLIADLLASIISDFVVNFGYNYLREEDVATARRLVQQNKLQAFDYIERERRSTFEEEELKVLFDDMITNPKSITPAFEHNYYSWIEYMLISFIAHLRVPDFDRDANDRLNVILTNLA